MASPLFSFLVFSLILERLKVSCIKNMQKETVTPFWYPYMKLFYDLPIYEVVLWS